MEEIYRKYDENDHYHRKSEGSRAGAFLAVYREGAEVDFFFYQAAFLTALQGILI